MVTRVSVDGSQSDNIATAREEGTFLAIDPLAAFACVTGRIFRGELGEDRIRYSHLDSTNEGELSAGIDEPTWLAF